MIRVAAFYHFAPVADRAALRDAVLTLARTGGVMGTVLIAGEGVNGTIAGAPTAVENVLSRLRAEPGFADLAHKDASAAIPPFHRLKVRLKDEIVTMGVPGVDARDTGHRVAPTDWDALIAQPGTLLIDTRNDYEVAIGSFVGAVHPQTASFRDFPAWARAHRDALATAERVAMFCTGGIRCEKASAFLRAEGIDEVYQLDGGILKYLQDTASEAWRGECFVFDERVAVGPGLAAGTHSLCRGCRMPVSEADRAAPEFVEGVSCPRCADARDEEQRARYAERHRQAALAEARGEKHVGRTQPDRESMR